MRALRVEDVLLRFVYLAMGARQRASGGVTAGMALPG